MQSEDSTPAPSRIASYPWYVQDWFTSETRARLTPLERCLYREILDLCWQDGDVTSDETRLQRLVMFSRKDFNRGFKVVRTLFTEVDGRLRHHKVDERRNSLVGFHKNRSEAGRKGGLKSGQVRSSASSSASSKREAKTKPSPSPSPSPSTSLESQSDTNIQAVVVNPAAANDQRFRSMMGAFLSLGVAVSETDQRKCAMLWVSLDQPGKDAASVYAGMNANGEWARREEKFVPRPWNYLQERHWERTAVTNGRDKPMSKAESAFSEGARMFMQGKASNGTH